MPRAAERPDGVRSATWHPSPNHGARRGGARPCLVVLHYTAMTSAEAALARLTDPEAAVSAHYLIGEGGQVWQLVAEAQRAWHAGAGAWGAVCDVNSASIGVELANDGASPFPEPQMAALEAVLRDVMARRGIAPAGVIGHSDCAPGRKADPGPRFDWARLARLGLAAPTPQAPAEAGCGAAAFADDMVRAGYSAPAEAEALLAALRARHRPWARGPLCAADAALARALAREAGAQAIDPGRARA